MTRAYGYVVRNLTHGGTVRSVGTVPLALERAAETAAQRTGRDRGQVEQFVRALGPGETVTIRAADSGDRHCDATVERTTAAPKFSRAGLAAITDAGALLAARS